MTRMRLLTRKELAEKLGVVQDTVTKWEQAGLPVAEPGSRGIASMFSLAAVKRWKRDREKAAQQNGTVDLVRDRARKERAQAELSEQMIAVRAGELVPRSEVEEVWSKEIAAVRSKLLAWPATLSDRVFRAAELGGVRGVEKEITAAVEELLLELSTGNHARLPKRPAWKKKVAKKRTAQKVAKKTATKKASKNGARKSGRKS